MVSGVAGAEVTGWKEGLSWVFKKGNGLIERDSADYKAQQLFLVFMHI